MQFARDAHQAEGWLLTQEPYLKKDEEKNAVCIVVLTCAGFSRKSKNSNLNPPFLSRKTNQKLTD